MKRRKRNLNRRRRIAALTLAPVSLIATTTTLTIAAAQTSPTTLETSRGKVDHGQRLNLLGSGAGPGPVAIEFRRAGGERWSAVRSVNADAAGDYSTRVRPSLQRHLPGDPLGAFGHRARARPGALARRARRRALRGRRQEAPPVRPRPARRRTPCSAAHRRPDAPHARQRQGPVLGRVEGRQHRCLSPEREGRRLGARGRRPRSRSARDDLPPGERVLLRARPLWQPDGLRRHADCRHDRRRPQDAAMRHQAARCATATAP